MTSLPENTEEKPPVFKQWRGWYLLVLGVLVAEIFLFFWLTQSFA